VVRTHQYRREKYEALMDLPEYAGIEFIRLRTPKQTRRWLRERTLDSS
jgi:hypothetical protein